MLEIIRANFKSGSDAAAQLASTLTFDPIARWQEGQVDGPAAEMVPGTGCAEPDY